MTKNTTKKEGNVESPEAVFEAKPIGRRQDDYFFPDYRITVKATSLVEAENKIKQILNK